ncbi:MAG: hypothetical protein M1297_01575 [Nitrospirae bacterium]|jgi:hypothetical protein|nr:hypothetical protein [Nitrospirota bacterium]
MDPARRVGKHFQTVKGFLSGTIFQGKGIFPFPPFLNGRFDLLKWIKTAQGFLGRGMWVKVSTESILAESGCFPEEKTNFAGDPFCSTDRFQMDFPFFFRDQFSI